MEAVKRNSAVKKYPAYKDSGVEWLGEIPNDWKVTSIKHLLSIPITDGPHTTPVLLDEGIPFISAEAIKNEKIDFEKKRGLISLKDFQLFSKKYMPQKGDVYMVKSGATTGNVAMVETDQAFTIWSPLAVFRANPRKLLSGFLFYYLQSATFRKSVELKWSFGTQQNIGMGVLSNLPIVYGSLEEQTAIARFLDEKTALIDKAITIKEQQIELLKERRQILIHRAVTRGLNPTAKMKDSGVEWIGEIPEHWEVLRNFALFQERNEPGNKDLPLLSVSIHTAVSNEELSGDENIRGKVRIEDKEKYKLVLEGDIVFNMMRAWQGAIGAVQVKGMVSPAYVVAKPKQKLFTNYFEYQFRTNKFIQQIDRVSKGITDFRKRLYWSEFKQIYSIVPPAAEQKQIVQFIEEIIIKVESAVSLKEKEIENLKEYKASLINSVVTGKIKVC